MTSLNSPARWIWCRGEPNPRNFYLYARKTLTFSRLLRRVTVSITADSRYQLYVNGTLHAHGPARCDRRWQCLDQWDVTSSVVKGTNVIAALVHHYGEWTFAYMLGRGGLLADIEAEFEDGSLAHWGTDGSWLVKPAAAWERNLPRMSIQLGYPEVYDARKEVEGWNTPLCDETDWEPAEVLGPPGIEPWPQLVPRDIPAMAEQPLLPGRVIDTGEVGTASTGHYVDLLRVAWSTKNGVGYLATHVWSPSAFDGEIHAGSQESLRLWFNGRLIVDHLVNRDPAPDQEIVRVQIREGWNTVLAKVTQGEGQWHFYFRILGQESEHLVYSPVPDESHKDADNPSPWLFAGPFPSTDLKTGHETTYPPEHSLDPGAVYTIPDGTTLAWRSAGVTRESSLTSVIMSREVRKRGTQPCIDNMAGLLTEGIPALFHPGPEHGTFALIDFGREVAGFPLVRIEGAVGGEIVDMGYGEILQDPRGEPLAPAFGTVGMLNPDRAGVHYADRYICRPGTQHFRTFDKRAFRYLQLDVRNVRSPLSVGPVSLLLSTYPVKYRGSFHCSDDLLNRIWEIGRWTVQLNMEDAYTDCPWRERGQWWGDARVQALVNYYAFGDLELIRRGLRQIAQSQTDEGFTRGIYPTDWSYAILPTFTLLWIISLHDYSMYSGDRELVRELWPAVEKVLGCFERYRGDHGLLRDVPHWLFVDWADVDTAGESASVNALYHGALRAASKLSLVLGFDAEPYAGNADRVREALDAWLWDDRESVYRDSFRAEGIADKVSEHANAWAIGFGVAREAKAGRILDALHAKECVRVGTPYFALYLLEALAADGRHERALDYIRTRWKAMLDWGATTWWEQWEPKASLCHGWSSGPTWFLSSEILGAKPLRPGWQQIAVEPHTAGLRFASGTVPTPHGDVKVDWTLVDAFRMVVESPCGMEVTLPVLQKGEVSATAGDSGSPCEVEWRPLHGNCARAVIRDPGRYTFVSR